MMYDWGWGYGSWAGALMMFLFWLLIVVGIIVLVRYLARQEHSQAKTEAPLDILKARYARGEIDKQEFEAKRKDLQS